MTTVRQVQLRRGSTTLDFNVSPYAMVAGSWSGLAGSMEMQVLAQATTLAELRRYVADVRKMLNQAGHYAGEQVGSAVYLYTKVCDDLTTTAEFGATWLRKKVLAGAVVEPDPTTFASGQYRVTLTVSLETEEAWRRAAPISVLVASSASTAVRSDGGLTVPATATLTARRVTWTASTGLTVRVRWLYSDNDCTFFFAETGANDMKALYLAGDNKLYIYDDGGNSASSAALTATAGDELDLVFKWDPTTPKLGIWVNGVANGTDAHGTLDVADTFQVFAPSTVSQHLLSWQLWPAALTDAQCAGLNAWGRPEPELMYSISPTDTKNTNAAYKFYNAPGEADALLRVTLSDGTQAYDKVRIGIRPLRIQTTTMWECESGTNGSDVADAADATASGGNVAQFTPADAAYAARNTVTIAANPADVAAFYGQYRLLLAVKDNAASTGINLIKWRTVIAGVNGDYSSEFSCAAVSTYSLLDLGTLSIPPGTWPEETEAVTGDVHAGSYFQIEIAAKNTAGLGGGTLNLDALYLQPVELEGTVENTALTTSFYQLIDFASPEPAHVAVADWRSLEWAGWGDYVGDRLAWPPVKGDAGLALLYAYRDTAEKAYPQDALTVWWWVVPRWL